MFALPHSSISLTRPSSSPTHVFFALPGTLVLRRTAGLSSTVMSSKESRGQHEIEGGYCYQCHHCHVLRGECPAFSFHSSVPLMLRDVAKGVSALECRTGGWVGRSAAGRKKFFWNPP